LKSKISAMKEGLAMQGVDRQLLRFGLVLALGSGMAFAAAHAVRQPVAGRSNPAPVILAVAMEEYALPEQSGAPADQSAKEGARLDQCALNPHVYAGNSRIGDKSARDGKKSRIVVCG
jgi:hypothetical protein